MDKILVLGAGKSSGVLIEYLANQASKFQYILKVADADLTNLTDRVSRFPEVEQFCGNLGDVDCLNTLISDAKIVVSLLPPSMHFLAAKICLEQSKHFLSASYISPELKTIAEEVKQKGLIFLMECGLDPGIDHMSAMKLIDILKEDGAKITSFRSYCGGLVAPESNTNPWGYKVTWNPRNVVLAGLGTSQYLENDQLKIVPYSQLFLHTTNLQFEDYGEYEAYPNRDSISYIEKYGLQHASSFLRGTIRYKGFCAAWDKLVKLGFTDDSVRFRNADKMKISEMTDSFCQDGISVVEYLKLEKEEFQKLDWLGIFSDSYLQVKSDATPAECLQKIIEDKWKLSEGDKDLVLMQHQIDFELDAKKNRIISSLAVEGNDSLDTAMARTVGLPLGIATLLLFQNKIVSKGVLTPVLKEIYNPILEELQTRKILFRENTYSS